MKLEMFGPLGAPRYVDYAKDINQSGTHLLDLVSDILDISRVESGTDSLYEQDIRIETVAQQVLDTLRLKADAAGVVCRLDAPEGLLPVRVDERKLRQIVTNLVGNAIKFNKPGGTVTVSLGRGPGRAVRDRGCRYRHRHRGKGHPQGARALRPDREPAQPQI